MNVLPSLRRFALALIATALPLACSFPEYGGFVEPVKSCQEGTADCDGNASNGCEAKLGGDVNNCGGCGVKCGAIHGKPTCSKGLCSVLCEDGFADCDGDEANGCEIDLSTDAKNCGACKTACDDTHGTATCAKQKCSVKCDSGFGDCDTDPSNGCETNLSSDANNCTACGMKCDAPGAATMICQQGLCSIGTCSAPKDDCDKSVSNGCETDTSNDENNCGMCANKCMVPNATAGCALGMCTVSTCDAGFDDCDHDPANGCEKSLDSDANNCGACGNKCVTPGATTLCQNGLCAINACAAPQADCNQIYADGCEVNTQTDVNNCGACAKACINAHGTTSCAGSTCLPQCDMGYADCDGNPNNGCETPTNTAQNCGACGQACMNANGSASCATGMCVLSCANGFKDCDMNPVNGCETGTNDKNNCGACGNVCTGGTPYCISSQCQACSSDSDEPNETVQAPLALPLPGTARVFDTVNDTFVLSAGANGRTTAKQYTFTTDSDVDVHHLVVTDDLFGTANDGAAPGKVAGIQVTLSSIPAGATYAVNTYYVCTTPGVNTGAMWVYNTAQATCDPQDANKTETLADWFECKTSGSSPSYNYLYALKCSDGSNMDDKLASNDSGVLQVEVKMVTPPSSQTCSPYTLTVRIFANQG